MFLCACMYAYVYAHASVCSMRWHKRARARVCEPCTHISFPPYISSSSHLRFV